MLYCILAYHPAGFVEKMPEADRATVLEGLYKLNDKYADKFGPVARLSFTDDAVTLRGPEDGEVIDGPFAETKEHLLGLYMVNCANRDEAVAIARDLRRVNKSAIYEIRPIPAYSPGIAVPGFR